MTHLGPSPTPYRRPHLAGRIACSPQQTSNTNTAIHPPFSPRWRVYLAFSHRSEDEADSGENPPAAVVTSLFGLIQVERPARCTDSLRPLSRRQRVPDRGLTAQHVGPEPHTSRNQTCEGGDRHQTACRRRADTAPIPGEARASHHDTHAPRRRDRHIAARCCNSGHHDQPLSERTRLMNSVHPKTLSTETPHCFSGTPDDRVTAFHNEVARVRSQVAPELLFHPDRPKPIAVGGVVCHTSAEVIAAYEPTRRTCTAGEWKRIESLVRESVRLAITNGPTTTQKRLKVVTAFSLWCLRLDVPLSAELIFTPARVEQYVASLRGTRSDRSRREVRSELSSVGRAATTRAGWAHPGPNLREHPTACPPYTSGELKGFWAAAGAQSTARRREILTSVLTLGLGAGLRPTEMLELRGEQVLEHPLHDNLLVLALVDRLVPVRRDVSDSLRLLCRARPVGRLLGGSSTAPSVSRGWKDLSTFALPASLPPLTWMRLRTTWAVKCLSGEVTIAEFAAMAGLHHSSAVSNYLAYVPVRSQHDAWMPLAAGMRSRRGGSQPDGQIG
ncbi:hypothetical protein DEAB109302_11660 [Dermacoccus abyssi]